MLDAVDRLLEAPTALGPTTVFLLTGLFMVMGERAAGPGGRAAGGAGEAGGEAGEAEQASGSLTR